MDNLENIGLDCPCYDFGDLTTPTFEIGDFMPIGANNGKLTITVNGEVVGEFYADQSENTTANVDLSNYTTFSDLEDTKEEIEQIVAEKASIADLDTEAGLREEEDTRLAGEIDQLGSELNAEVNARTQADTALTNALNNKANISALTAETTNRENADNELQSQIDAITSQSDVVDIVGTYAQLQAYDTSHLGDNDIVKVLTDSTHDNAPSYFRWNKTAGTWSYVGSESVAYTKAEADDRFVPKTRTVNGKALSANVTLTTNDLTNDSGFLTEEDLTDYVKNTDYATDNKGGVLRTLPSLGTYTSGMGYLKSQAKTLSEYGLMDTNGFVGKGTLENVLNGRKYLMPEYTLELPTTGEENKLYLTPATEQPDIEATASGKDIELADASEGDLIDWTIKGDTEQASYTGKNLADFVPSTDKTYLNGYTVESDKNTGVITLNGTNTSTFSNLSAWIDKPLPSGTFTFSIDNISSEFRYCLRLSDSNGTNHDYFINKNSSSVTFTTNYEATRHRIYIDSIFTSVPLTNFKFRYQLEKGSTPTDFEPYVGGSASPNPEYPQEVKTVTGRNTVSVVGKNLFNLAKIAPDMVNSFYPTTATGRITYTDNSIVLSSDIAFSPNFSAGSAKQNEDFYTTLEKNTDYTFSFIGTNVTIIGYAYDQSTNRHVKLISDTDKTVLTFNSGNYDNLIVRFGKKTSGTPSEYSNIQLEKGSVATPFQPYSGQEVEINLDTRTNKFDVNTAIKNTLYAEGNTLYTGYSAHSVSFPVEPNTAYIYDNPNYQLTKEGDGCIIFTEQSPRSGLAILGKVEATSAIKTTNFTTPANAHWATLYYAWGSDNENAYKDMQIFLEGTETIELCKLGDYQDRIFKDGDTWKIEKQTNKIVVDGTENWQYPNSGTNYTFFQLSRNNFKLKYGNTYDFYANNEAISTSKSDNFLRINASPADMRTEQGFGFSSEGGGWLRISVPNTIATAVDTFKTWLSSHHTTIYYALATPTVTEITYQPLIDQLNALETLATVKGYNHIMTDTPSVQPFLDFTYFRPDPTVTKDEWLWIENHYEQLGGERRYTHNLSVNHNTAQGHWDYTFTIVGKEASHYTQLAQVAYYLFKEHAGLHIPVSGTYTEGNDVYLLTKITASSLSQVTIEMRKLSDGSVKTISTGAVPVLDTIS